MGLPKAMKYGYQFIFAFVPGGASINAENQTVTDNATYLAQKRVLAGDGAKVMIVSLTSRCGTGHPDLSSFKGMAGDGSVRVYLVGHGDPDSSTLGDLNVDQLAAMLKTLGTQINVLGLVGCNSGLSELGGDRPRHSLAHALYPLVKTFVTEVHGYTGTVNMSRNLSTYSSAQSDSVRFTDERGRVLHVADAAFTKNVTQQTHSKGGKSATVPRKLVVNASGVTWGQD